MKKLFKKELFIEIAFIFLLSLTPLLWFKEGLIIVGHDNVFALDPTTFLKGRLSTWIEHAFGQSQDLIMGTIPIHLIDAVPFLLGFDLQTTQKIVYVFWFFMMGFSAYVLASTINPQSRFFKLTATILYQFNFFLLQAWWIAERTKFSAYIALPLVLSIFIKVLRRELGLVKGALYISFIFLIFNAGGLYGIPLYGGLFIAVILFVVFFTYTEVSKMRFYVGRRLLILVILSIFGYLLANSYYILPSALKLKNEYTKGLTTAGGISGVSDWAKEISANTSFINLFRLQGIPEWYDNREHPYAKFYLNNKLLIIASFVWLVLIFLPLAIVKDKKKKIYVLFFFLVFLVGVFFASGTHPPLGRIYAFLMQYIPGFAVFRSPYYKFAPAIFLSASFLIAFLIDHFRGKTKKIFFFIFIIFTLLYHFPYFTGNIFSWREGFSTRLKVPEYVFQFGKWVNQEKKGDGRVLFLPPNSPNFQYSTYEWKYLSFQSVPTLLSNASVIINNDRINSDERELTLALYSAMASSDKDQAKKLLSLLRVQYLVLQDDVVVLDAYSPIQLNANTYRKFLEKELGLSPVKIFGKWTIYEVETNQVELPHFFTSEYIDILSGPVSDIPSFINFSGNINMFAIKDDIPKEASFSKNMTSDFPIPVCLNCKGRDRPFIRFPERNVLPDSPLYPLVLLREELSLHKNDPKSLIYDYLGISVKRVSEISEMAKSFKPLTGEVVNPYLTTLRLIDYYFARLPKYEDKLKIAEDLDYFMSEERSALSQLLGVYVASGNSAILLGSALSGVSTLSDTIDPYIFKKDISSNKLFQVTVNDTGKYTLYVRRNQLESVLRSGEKLSVTIDDKISKEIIIDKLSTSDVWLDFGEYLLDKGIHTVVFSFPKPINLSSDLTLERTEVNTTKDTNCYTTFVKDFNYRKRYRIKVDYLNNFTLDLRIFTWELREKGRRLVSADRLKYGPSREQFTRFTEASSDTIGFEIGLCALRLTSELINERRFTIETNEMIFPVLFFIPVGQKPSVLRTVEYRKISPTKYEVLLQNASNPIILAFMERYDDGWELLDTKNAHFKINGYGNGWLITEKSKRNLVISYKPQKLFLFGTAISIVFSIIGISYLLFDIRRKR